MRSILILALFTCFIIPQQAEAGRLGVCYECTRSNGQKYHFWSGENVIGTSQALINAAKCRGLHDIEHVERGEPRLCDATDGILRYGSQNDPFDLCPTQSSNHRAWIGGENGDLILLQANSGGDYQFFGLRDGRNLQCGVDVASGRNFTAVRHGENRDIVDIYVYLGNGKFDRHTDRIQDGRDHKLVVNTTYAARLYGRAKDILKLYGMSSAGAIRTYAQGIFDGQNHELHALTARDVGVVYGNNKDIRWRFCFDESRWNVGAPAGIGAPFAQSCNRPAPGQ